jgi:hypothetical protein
MKMAEKILIFLVLAGSQLMAADVVSTLLKDSIATFSDSYDLIYYSVRSALLRDAREQKYAVKSEFSVTNARIETYLESRGIYSRRDRQPITRKDFARIVFQRFDLPRGFFTKLLGTSSWYYRDAVNAGLFRESDQSDGTMSTKEMLSVFTQAEAQSRTK